MGDRPPSVTTPPGAAGLASVGSPGTHRHLRIDTPAEGAYCRHGGILPYVLRGLAAR